MNKLPQYDMSKSSRAVIIEDSVSPDGIRLATFECEWPRYIHGDFMTHREFSRNGRSSRAEPIGRALERAERDPVAPLVWMYDARKMQHGAVMTADDAKEAAGIWDEMRTAALDGARKLWAVNLHRQYLLRTIEPYLRIKMIVSSTSFANFLALRLHPAPMPEIQQLAASMARELCRNLPTLRRPGEWHLPYVTQDERDRLATDILVKLSTSRLARVSFDPLTGANESTADHCLLHDRLMTSDPMHASPSEHPAMCSGDPRSRSGNFKGWIQYRHMWANESKTNDTFDVAARLVEYGGRDYIV